MTETIRINNALHKIDSDLEISGFPPTDRVYLFLAIGKLIRKDDVLKAINDFNQEIDETAVRTHMSLLNSKKFSTEWASMLEGIGAIDLLNIYKKVGMSCLNKKILFTQRQFTNLFANMENFQLKVGCDLEFRNAINSMPGKSLVIFADLLVTLKAIYTVHPECSADSSAVKFFFDLVTTQNNKNENLIRNFNIVASVFLLTDLHFRSALLNDLLESEGQTQDPKIVTESTVREGDKAAAQTEHTYGGTYQLSVYAMLYQEKFEKPYSHPNHLIYLQAVSRRMESDDVIEQKNLFEPNDSQTFSYILYKDAISGSDETHFQDLILQLKANQLFIIYKKLIYHYCDGSIFSSSTMVSIIETFENRGKKRPDQLLLELFKLFEQLRSNNRIIFVNVVLFAKLLLQRNPLFQIFDRHAIICYIIPLLYYGNVSNSLIQSIANGTRTNVPKNGVASLNDLAKYNEALEWMLRIIWKNIFNFEWIPKQ